MEGLLAEDEGDYEDDNGKHVHNDSGGDYGSKDGARQQQDNSSEQVLPMLIHSVRVAVCSRTEGHEHHPRFPLQYQKRAIPAAYSENLGDMPGSALSHPNRFNDRFGGRERGPRDGQFNRDRPRMGDSMGAMRNNGHMAGRGMGGGRGAGAHGRGNWQQGWQQNMGMQGASATFGANIMSHWQT